MNLMSNQNFSALKPGEINLSLIPVDWPLTPLGENKNPYKAGWQNKPFTVKEKGTDPRKTEILQRKYLQRVPVGVC